MNPGESLDDISGNFFSPPHKKVKKQPKNYTKKTGNFLDWDFRIWPKRDGFRDILGLHPVYGKAFCTFNFSFLLLLITTRRRFDITSPKKS